MKVKKSLEKKPGQALDVKKSLNRHLMLRILYACQSIATD